MNLVKGGIMKFSRVISLFFIASFSSLLHGQVFPDSELVLIPGGTFTMGESANDYQGPPGGYDAFIHTITLSSFQMGKTEITNQQYVDFLNAAYTDGILEVQIETGQDPDLGLPLVYGSGNAPDEYRGEALLNLAGTRVMKDHDNGDGDDDPFTGEIEPENPLNITYIGYDETRAAGDQFYVKDPADPNDFDWMELTNYYHYTNVPHQEDMTILLNDYNDWEELQDYPNNLPSLEQVKNWPATFVRWYGAKAFALFYGLDLPAEAQWEYGAQGGAGFVYATSGGNVDGDGTSANWNYLEANPSRGHVLDVRINDPNPYGLYNMAGNVWEWVENGYASDYYNSTDGATDPINTTDTGFKVRRGGSWNCHQSTLKSAARGKDEPFKGNDHFGFRVVKNSGESIIHRRETLPRSIQLHQNYPNPFNPSTKISYTIPHSGFVILKVHDMRGREIQTLVSEAQTAGRYNVRFEANHLPSSIYFYSLHVGNYFTETKKMLFLR